MLNRQEKTGEGGQAPHTERMKIYLAELGEKADSSVQGGTRPVIVLQNNAGNRSSPTVIVAPITSKLEKPHLPTHVVLGQSNLPKQSMVLLEQVMTIDQKLLIKEYYTTTLLANSVTPTAVYDLEAKLDGYMILDPYDVNMAAEIIYKKIIESKDKNQLRFYLQRAEKKLKEYDLMKQIEIMAVVRHFIRFYEFLIQVSCFEDVELHKKYLFLTYFVSFVNISQPGGGFDLSGKIKADNFIQKKGEEHKTTKVTPDPIVKLPTADDFNLNEDKVKRLSEIIDEINSKTGKTYDNDVVIKAMLQIKDLMMKSEKLRESAKANTESDFAFSYFDGIDDALIEGLSQNQDFFSLLLSNDEMKKEVLGIFVSEIYKSLREDK